MGSKHIFSGFKILKIKNILVFFLLISVFETTAMLKITNLQYFPLAPFAN